MALIPGNRVGPYEIVGAIGAGGMGEVYRARDTRLGRDVALKVLPQALAGDQERMARFRREAQVLASLNHPNIAAIYGFEDSSDVHALVMELVEGPTLADRIKTGAIPIDEALPIAKQIAEGLEYAHERGIVHRDLKPANIKLSSNDAVKILDFGLAKALEGDAASVDISSSPTISRMATQAGIILGTAAYMSPEQAKGKAVDRRTDIWAFGCLLYEMLAGKQAFGGESVTDVLASVIRAEPDWSLLPPGTPPAIRNPLQRCLKKDPRQRLQSMGDARIAIEEALAIPSQAAGSGFLPEEGAPPSSARRFQHWLPLTMVLVVLAAAAGWWAGHKRNHQSQNWSAQMLGGPSIAIGPRISPDGHTLAFEAFVDGLTQVAIMDTDSGDWTVLTQNRSRGYVNDLSWSPDGSEIYFDRYLGVPNGIYTVSRVGGDERLVLDHAMAPNPLPDGSLVVIRVNKDRNYQLSRFWPDSGSLEALDALVPGWGGVSPVRAFRDGKGVVFLGTTLEQTKTDISPHLYALDLASGKARRLAPELSFAPTSFSVIPLAIGSDGQSVLTETEAGDLYRIISIPRYGQGPIPTLFSLTLPPNYIDADKEGDLYLDQVDRPLEILRFSAVSGTPEVLAGPMSAPADDYQTLQLPDGRVVFDTSVAGKSRLVMATPKGEAVPFIQTEEETSSPACSLGEDEIAFLLGASGHRVVAEASVADGRIVRRLNAIPGNEVTDLAASPDGKTLYYVVSGIVWAIGASGGERRRIGPGDAIAVDPNGKDLIFQLNDSQGVRLVRVPVSGGTEEPLRIESALPPNPSLISPNAIGKDGRIVMSLSLPNSWFFGAGILDPRSGQLERISMKYTGDVLAPAWLDDGRILSSGWPLRATLWRFHPTGGEEK
jgi:eukaryotic-like serine/threonine-protein kinase